MLNATQALLTALLFPQRISTSVCDRTKHHSNLQVQVSANRNHPFCGESVDSFLLWTEAMLITGRTKVRIEHHHNTDTIVSHRPALCSSD